MDFSPHRNALDQAGINHASVSQIHPFSTQARRLSLAAKIRTSDVRSAGHGDVSPLPKGRVATGRWQTAEQIAARGRSASQLLSKGVSRGQLRIWQTFLNLLLRPGNNSGPMLIVWVPYLSSCRTHVRPEGRRAYAPRH